MARTFRRSRPSSAPRNNHVRLTLEELEDRVVPSSAGDIEWVRQFGSGFPAADSARAVDADGNVYVAGQVEGTLPGQTSAGWADAYLRKYDASGAELWTRQFGLSGSDVSYGVAVEASGIYVVGSVSQISGNSDVFVRRYDASGTELWTRQFGTIGSDYASSVAVDASGVYVVGQVGGTLPGQVAVGGFFDAYVRKYDLSGTELWTRQFGASGSDFASGVGVDASGVYVVGLADGSLPGQTGAGFMDAFVRKYDASGTELWTRQFGSGGTDFARGVAVDASGIYVVGNASGSLPGQTGGGAFVRKYDAAGAELWTRVLRHTGSNQEAHGVAVDASGVYLAGKTTGALPGQASAGGDDAFVRKYDASGGELWTRQFGTTGTDWALGVAGASSGIYVTGFTNGALPGQTSAGINDAFVRKYDVAGTELWTRQFGSGLPANDIARAVDADGNVYVAGEVGGALPGYTSAGNFDAFVRKYDASGTELWTRQFGTNNVDRIFGVAVDASGIYVVGSAFGALPGQTGAGFTDAFVRKYDAGGTELWTRQFGTSGIDQALSVAVDASGVYLAGSTTGTLSGQTSAGGLDAFVRKYDASGLLLWTRQFGTSASDQANGVAVDASGIYVAGQVGGTFSGQTSAGGSDDFVRKYDASGNEVWTRQFGASGTDRALGIAADATGVYVAGEVNGTLPGQTNAGGTFDAFVRKYDASGAELWTCQFGTTVNDLVSGVAVGASGVYLSGHTSGTFAGHTYAGGISDAFVRKYDASGTVLWTRQFGTGGADQASGIAVGASGLFVAGVTGGIFPGQTGGGSINNDVFVAKLVDSAPNGPPTANAGGPYSVAEGGAVSLSGSGTDPENGPLTYAWDLDNNGSFETAAQNVSFSAAGLDGPTTRTVRLRVTDNGGLTAESTATVNVTNGNPVAADHAVTTNEDAAVSLNVLAGIQDAGVPDTHTAVAASFTTANGGQVTIAANGTATYTPALGFAGTDSFDYTAKDDDGGTDTGTVIVTVRNLVDVSGRVFDDKDSDGVFELGDGEAGINGVAVQLLDQTSGALIATRTTAADGTYSFDVNLGAGSFKILAAQPPGFLDGRESAGNLGGTVDNTQDGNQITGISVGAPGTTADAVDYLFAEIRPSQVMGLVWQDFNNDAEVNFGERALQGVAVELTGTDDRGQAISRSAVTDVNGIYSFIDLRPSSAAGYTLRAPQPAGFLDGLDSLGTVNGATVGNGSVNDAFSAVVLPRPASLAENYNFGERPATDGGVTGGQTATIGFWQNKNGQSLINALNGGSTATQLGNWLAATFSNMYGANAGANNLTGKTNAQVAAFYKTLFARTAATAAGDGPAKMDAQVLATAFAAYVTNQTLAGTTAASYGFLVTANGVGTRTFNVDSNGTAFCVANNSAVSVLDLLLAVNSRSRNGLMYDVDGDGDANDALETSYRTMANSVFSGINEAGDI